MTGSNSNASVLEAKTAVLASLSALMSLICIVLAGDAFWIAAAKAPVFALCLVLARTVRGIWPSPETRSLSWALIRHHLAQGVPLSLMISVGVWPYLDAAIAARMFPMYAVLFLAGNVAYDLLVPPRPCPPKAKTP